MKLQIELVFDKKCIQGSMLPRTGSLVFTINLVSSSSYMSSITIALDLEHNVIKLDFRCQISTSWMNYSSHFPKRGRRCVSYRSEIAIIPHIEHFRPKHQILVWPETIQINCISFHPCNRGSFYGGRSHKISKQIWMQNYIFLSYAMYPPMFVNSARSPILTALLSEPLKFMQFHL